MTVSQCSFLAITQLAYSRLILTHLVDLSRKLQRVCSGSTVRCRCGGLATRQRGTNLACPKMPNLISAFVIIESVILQVW